MASDIKKEKIIDRNYDLMVFHCRVDRNTQSKLCKFMEKPSKDTRSEYNPEKHDLIIYDLIRIIIHQEDGDLKQQKAIQKLLLYFNDNIKYPKLPKTHVSHDLTQQDYQDARTRAKCIIAGINLNRKGLTKTSARVTNGTKIREFTEKNNLDNLEPEIIRMNLVGFFRKILKDRIKDIHRENKQKKNSFISIDKPISGGDGTNSYKDFIADPKLSGLDILIKKEKEKKKEKKQKQRQELKAIIIRYIEQDPNDKLKQAGPRNRPDCNCQILLRKLLIDGEYNVTNIANEFGIARATLQDFLERRPNSKRKDAKCLKLLIEEIEKNEQVNLRSYINI